MPPLQLREDVWRELREPARRTLKALEGWDLNFLRDRLVRRECSAARAEELIQEYRRYLALSLLSAGRSHCMAGPVDDVWHEHILHTREYDYFCRALFGTFIHHSPASGSINADDRASYEKTVEEMKLFFASFAADAWLSPNDSFCDSCNDSTRDEPQAVTLSAPA